jgi:N-acetylneuraminic acid mutarotase
MQGRGSKVLAALLAAMLLVFAGGVLAATDAIDLPGDWRRTLGLEDESQYPPCRRGLYRHDPAKPPPSPGHWRFEPRAPRAPVEGSAIAIGPVIYATNGERPDNLHTVLAYDTRTRTWSEPTRSPIGLNHVQAAAYRGRLYLAGGYLDGYEATSQFWEYDPQTGRWRELPPMGQARGGAAAAVVDGKLYVAGGAPQTFYSEVEGTPYGTLEIYDFETGEWETGPDMPVPRHHTVGVGLGGKFYVAGGRSGLLDLNNDKPPVAAFDRYNPQEGRWERLPHMPFGVGYEGITAAAGKVVTVGGEDQAGWEDGGGWADATAWAFDPKTNRWQRLPDLHIERRGFGAATARGRIYALMGSYCPGLTPNGPEGTRTVESLPIGVVDRLFDRG